MAIQRPRPAAGALRLALAAALPLAACAAPAVVPPPTAGAEPDLARTFAEPFHGYLLLAPLAIGPGDRVEGGTLDADAGALRIDADGGVYTSRVLRRAEPFTDLLPSWNVAAPPGAGFAVEVRVGREDGPWSPWLAVGERGRRLADAERVVRFEGGRVEVDVFRSEEPWTRARLRVRGLGGEGELRVERLAVALTDGRALDGAVERAAAEPWPRREVSVAVPARSQKDESEALRSRVCSPTSVAMVLEMHGVRVPTAELAAQVHDGRHDIYGNWSNAVQAAYERGVAGTLLRVSSWRAVEHFLSRGVPLIASIRAEEGELAGAPYPRTSGHLLVVRGLAPGERVLVNDPAASWPGAVRRAYAREDMERVWLANGGVAYVLDGRVDRAGGRP